MRRHTRCALVTWSSDVCSSDLKGAGKLVHIEMDTGHAQDFENYVNDRVSGRLPVQAEHRVDVQPLSVTGDDTFRLGESNRRILELQRVMSEEGYRAAGGEELDQDGVYRPGMQGALLDFQRAHGLPQTGNIDQIGRAHV